MEYNSNYLICWVVRRALCCLLITLTLLPRLVAAGNHSVEQGVNETKITLALKNATLQEFIHEVESKTPFKFTFDERETLNKVLISVKAKNESLDKVLARISASTRLEFKQVNNNIHIRLRELTSPKAEIAPQEQKQQIKADLTVTGKVSDEKGDAVPGVNVLLKGTTTGTATGSEGEYSITVPDGNGTLVFSYIGYVNQEVPINNQSIINVSIVADIKSLEEVVVIGYGSVQRKDLTGSISSVGNEAIKDLALTRVDQALLGKVPGVQVKPSSGEPGAPPQIRIRGIGSISAGAGPLYVVDGFPIASIQSLNPNDIESMDVLKDASATAIYGSRGSNGVIIINTKRGKTGKPSISLDTYYGFQKIAKVPHFMSGIEQAQHYFDGIRNRNIDEGNDVTIPVSQWKIPVPVTLLEVLEGREPTMPGVTLNFRDPLDEVLRVAPQQQHQLTVTGGSENIKYALSGEYLSQDGIILNSNFKRFSARANIDARLSNKLSVKMNLNPSFTDKTNVGGAGADEIGSDGNRGSDIIYNALVIPQYYSLLNPDGSYFPFGDGLDAVVSTQNPLALAREVQRKQRGTGILGNINLEYAIIPDLKLNVMLGANIMNIKGMRFKPLLPAFNNNPATGTDNSSMLLNWLTEYTLNYNKVFGKHSISGLVGFTAQKERFESNFLTSNRYPNNLVPTLSAVSGLITNGSGDISEWSILSYLSRVNYSFNNKYYITASVRTDGSSRFGAANKWGYSLLRL
ncbi:SusC/RagA family TonB-linked outer membrane protein [Rhodocytophaga rosea]|uniref:SusC/RagA family TonB-linked outer membrane protein n=1 Tax=Rhodocytophaga rosea TaxID=2704465 RepID=UPI00293B8E24|nr:SusC/RagA family TonB-linked outer membrane protein [Rhodocytophaga rosea]